MRFAPHIFDASPFALLTLMACADPGKDVGETACTPEEWYLDLDGDGFGGADYVEQACGQPAGHVAEAGDCDEYDVEVHPGAIEVCDGVDNDCDGDTDGTATDPGTWLEDADADGYGNDAVTITSCEPPEGYVADGGDCDDDDPRYHPGADEQDCGSQEDLNCDGSVSWTDGDGDGWAACEDCDDSEPLVHPEAEEHCDEVDEDCDGTADENATDAELWYPDGDADGAGDAEDVLSACMAPEGWVADASDCDDADANAHPGGTEVCDGADRDEDCDGAADDGDESATGQFIWYADGDGDGYGDDASQVSACERPLGHVAVGTDCDDTAPSVNVGATETCVTDWDDDCDGAENTVDSDGCVEWHIDADADGYGDSASLCMCTASGSYAAASDDDCDDGDATTHPGAAERCDGADQDCDGDIDEGVTSTFYADADGDGFGDSTRTTETCAASAGWVTDETDCQDGDATAYPGAAEVCNDGVDNDCDGAAGGCGIGGFLTVEDADASFEGEERSDYAGSVVVGAGDIDGDGLGDIAIAAWGVDDAAATAGTVYVVSGPFSGALDAMDAALVVYGDSSGDQAGWSLAGGHDVDGDGVPDLLVGASGDDDGGNSAGAAYLVLGGGSGTASLRTADAQLLGETTEDRAGVSVTLAGDIDGDGIGEMLVGSAWSDRGGEVDGWTVYVVDGGSRGATDLSASVAFLVGEAPSDNAGWKTVGPGDIDGDGLADVLVGTQATDTSGIDAGGAYLFLGPLAGTITLSGADAAYLGVAASDFASQGLGAPGDMDGDGTPDILVGSPNHDAAGAEAGAVYLVSGSRRGSVPLSTAEATLLGVAAGDRAGWDTSGAGDVDGDGWLDLLVGAPYEATGGTRAGAVYLMRGPVSGTVSLASADATITGSVAYGYAGDNVAGAGDTNGDGFDDLIFGAPEASVRAESSGAAYLFFGGGI